MCIHDPGGMLFCFAFPSVIIMTKLWKRLLYLMGILSLVTIDLCTDYGVIVEKLFETVRNQELANGDFMTLLEYSALCMIGGSNHTEDLKRGVLVTVLFLIFTGGVYLLTPIFSDMRKITKDENVNVFELFEFLRVS